MSKPSTKTIAAKQYYKNSALQKDHAAELIDMLDIPHGGLVLDLGCGTGHLAAVLSDFVGPDGKVVAIDPDAERIALAKKTNSRPNIQNFVANDQTFPGEGYDLIVSTHVIHWIKDKRALFTHIFKKLAPGGTFGFVTYNGTPDHPHSIVEAFRMLISPNFLEDLIYVKMNFEEKETYLDLASSAGFEDSSDKLLKKELTFDSVDKFLQYWAGVSHGDFSTADVNKQKVQFYKEHHTKELRSAVINLPTLCMTLRKPNLQ